MAKDKPAKVFGNRHTKSGGQKLNPKIKRLTMTKRIQGARER